jgi:hypothetical protein
MPVLTLNSYDVALCVFSEVISSEYSTHLPANFLTIQAYEAHFSP